MRTRALPIVGLAWLLLAGLVAPAGASHSCTAGTGTLIVVPLPSNPLAPYRTFLYFWDAARTTGTGGPGNPLDPEDDHRGTWLYLENGKKAGLQIGGSWLVPLAVMSDTRCGATVDENGITATAAEFADDLLFVVPPVYL